MSDAKYVAAKGGICSSCGSKEIEGCSSVEVDGGGASQEVRCLKCDRRWYDLYELVGYMTEGD